MIEHSEHNLDGLDYGQVADITDPAYVANANEVLAAIDVAIAKMRVLCDNEVAQFGEVVSDHMQLARTNLIDARTNTQRDLDAFLDSM